MVSKYEAWLDRCLTRVVSLQSENVWLKMGFARALQSGAHAITLKEAERFQSQLLDNDATISLLRHELLVHLQRQKQHLNHARTPKQQANLEKDIMKMEQTLEQQRNTLEQGADPEGPKIN